MLHLEEKIDRERKEIVDAMEARQDEIIMRLNIRMERERESCDGLFVPLLVSGLSAAFIKFFGFKIYLLSFLVLFVVSVFKFAKSRN